MADYTPTLGDYTDLKPFRFWCQKVLPLVYDDSLSYYELLCKVVDYLNKTMEDVDTMHDDVVNLHAAYVQLQTYVNTYFDNLDVQEEINNKLDEMADDGSLSALISPFIPDIVSAWLNEHITPTTPAIDNTLTVSGAAADAKTVGDNAILSSAVNGIIVLSDNVLNSMSITSITQLPVNRFYGLNNVSVLTDGPTDVITPPYNGFIMIARHSDNAWPCVILVTNSGQTFTGTYTGNNMRWDSTILRVNNLYSNVIASSQLSNIPLLTDSELNRRSITSITQLPINKIYGLNNVSVLTDGPTDVITPPYNGFIMIARHSDNAWPCVILVTNSGKTFTGTYTGNNMRWDNIQKTVDTINDYSVMSSLADSVAILTDSVLTAISVTSITQLPINRVYGLQNVTVLTDLPEQVSAPAYGGLVIMRHSNNAWPIVFLVTNNGNTYTGTYTGSTMRWSNQSKNIVNNGVLSSNYDGVGVITDSYLTSHGITTLRSLPVNRIYSLNNVSNLTDMPLQAVAPYNGYVSIFRHSSNGWPLIIYTNNTGVSYFGTYTGSQTRWEMKNLTTNNITSYFANKNITLVGDSIMYGSHMSDAGQGSREVITIRDTTVYENTSTKVWSYLFKNYLESTYGATITNQSFPGCSFNDVINNIETLIPASSDYAIIMLGVNDWGSPDSIYNKCLTILNYCYRNAIRPIFITPYPTNNMYVNEMSVARCNIKRLGDYCVDFYSTFNFMLYTMGIDITTLFDDSIHYNDAGQPYIFEAVKKSLNL